MAGKLYKSFRAFFNMSLKNYVIGIAILILTIAVVIYGVNLVYDAPEYGDFCGGHSVLKPSDNDIICPAVCVELWELDAESGECVFNECGSGCGADGVTRFETKKQCEIVLGGDTCQSAYEEARENYSRNVFLIALPLGVLIIILGALAFGLESVGAGLMGGGVGVILWGIGGFWRFAEDWLKFFLSLIGLVVLIWLAYYFNEKLGKRSKRRRKK